MEKLLTLLDRDNLVVAAVTVICVCAMYVFGPDGSKEIINTGLGGLLGMALGSSAK